MLDLFEIIKVIAIVQVILVVLLLGLAYGLKLYMRTKSNRMLRVSQRLKKSLDKGIKRPKTFTISPLKLYQQNQVLLLELIQAYDATQDSSNWQIIRKQVLNTIILPNARRYARSKQWTKRYIASQSFKLTMHPDDMNILKILIDDPVAIISIHSALIAVHYNSQFLVDAVITSFAKGRHIQQSLYAQLVSANSPYLVDFVHNRLYREQDPYVKIFCYRMLSNVAMHIELIDLAFSDMHSQHLELRLAAMVYVYTHDSEKAAPLLVTFLEDELWEVRARAAKLLGKIGKKTFAQPLETCLHDKAWWVRINAAEALAALGPSGVSLLKKQVASVDQYAYDAATEVLSKRVSS